jgi:hypothetical protein
MRVMDEPVDLPRVIAAFEAALSAMDLTDDQRVIAMGIFRDKIAVYGEHTPDGQLPSARQVIDAMNEQFGDG